jgi:hypothetical protein
MALPAYPSMISKVYNLPRITCMTCGEPMFLSLIEPASWGYEVRSFSCLKCNIVEKFTVEL